MAISVWNVRGHSLLGRRTAGTGPHHEAPPLERAAELSPEWGRVEARSVAVDVHDRDLTAYMHTGFWPR